MGGEREGYRILKKRESSEGKAGERKFNGKKGISECGKGWN